MITLLLITGVLISVSIFLYNQYVFHQRDIHEIALNQQSNIGQSRQEDETAVYRNNLVPIGMPLATGLSIRQGFRLRNGNLRDIWSVVMTQKNHDARLRFISADDDELVCDIDHLNGIFKRLVEYFESIDCKRIGIAVPVYTFHGFVTTMACWSHGLTAYTFNRLPRTQCDVDVLIVDESQLRFAEMFQYKKIIVVSKDQSVQYPGQDVVNWSSIGDLDSVRDDSYEYKYDPSYDNVIPLVDTHNFQSFSYTHQNFVSSIASIIRTLPLGQEFGRENLLIGYEDSTINYWPKILAILLYGGSVVIGSTSNKSFNTAIETHNPTILSVDSTFANKYFSSIVTKSESTFQAWKLHRAIHLLSQGVFSKNSSLKEYSNLRIVYIGSTSPDSELSSLQLTTMRALLGCRVICERFLEGTIGAILSTNFYDYRVFSNDRLINRGTGSLSLELKLYKSGTYDISKRHGELCIHGFTIGRPVNQQDLALAIERGEKVGSEGWMPTRIIGKFGSDGCFYEDV